jgi:hypothetical protein
MTTEAATPSDENLLYRLFSKSKSEWVWRENFPCPHEPRCPYREHCCFQWSASWGYAFAGTLEDERERRAQFHNMKALLRKRSTNPHTTTEECSLPLEVYDSIWHEICPCTPGPHSPYGERALPQPEHNYEVSLQEFSSTIGLPLYTALCAHFYKHKSTHQKICRMGQMSEVAHSFTELFASFHHPEIMLYHLHWMIKLKRGGVDFPFPTVPFKVLGEGDQRLQCQYCTNRLSLRVRIIVATPPALFKMPTCLITCTFCHRATVLSIYE